MHLAVLARCFELEDEYQLVELDHVTVSAPEYLEGHREGLRNCREQRRQKALDRTRSLMGDLDRAGVTANENVVLHSRIVKQIVGALNATAENLQSFHSPLGVDIESDELGTIAWSDAARDADQWKTAGKELGRKTVEVVGTVGVVALVYFVPKKGKRIECETLRGRELPIRVLDLPEPRFSYAENLDNCGLRSSELLSEQSLRKA